MVIWSERIDSFQCFIGASGLKLSKVLKVNKRSLQGGPQENDHCNGKLWCWVPHTLAWNSFLYCHSCNDF